MGKGKMATELGLEIHDAEVILNRYHKTVPFVPRNSKRLQSNSK